VTLAPAILHAAYTNVHANRLNVSVSEDDLRKLLSSAYLTLPSPTSSLQPFADPATNPSALVEARKISCVPRDPEAYATSDTDIDVPKELQENCEVLRGLGAAVAHQYDIGPLLATILDLDMASLADALREAGPACTSNAQILAAILNAFPSAGIGELASVFAMLASTAGESLHL
jgi:hypothetical protein